MLPRDVPRHVLLGGVLSIGGRFGHLTNYITKKNCHRKHRGQLTCSMADLLTNFLALSKILGDGTFKNTPHPENTIADATPVGR